MTNTEAHARLKGTLAGEKNEILFSQFNINYNEVELIFRRGSILLRQTQHTEENTKTVAEEAGTEETKEQVIKKGVTGKICLVHDDLVEKEAFYLKYDLIN